MNTPDRTTLLNRIRAEDFALYEVALYLDAHPRHKKALQYYAEHQKIAQMLKKSFEEAYGPLTIYGNTDEDAWKWTEGPWPWEKEAN